MIKGKLALSKYVGCSRWTIDVWAKAGKLPKPDKLVKKGYSRQPHWHKETIDNWRPEKVESEKTTDGNRFKFAPARKG